MWDDARRLDALAGVLAALTLVFVVWIGVNWLVRQPAFAIREVVVRGAMDRVNPAHLKAVVRSEWGGTFFTMNLDKSRAALAEVPWVKGVALRRQWPDRVEVTIDEHIPLARWNDAALVDTTGSVFVADYNGELPQLSGPEGRAAEVAERYREWGIALLPFGLTVQELRLSPRAAWQLIATGPAGPLTIEMGRDDAGARFARFLGAYERTIAVLARNGTRVDRVDLRYRNGFAARVPGFREKPTKKVT
jgi:cell division protein FtsQ